jgi:hypothetical protein
MQVCDRCGSKDSVSLVQIRTLMSSDRETVVQRLIELCSDCRRQLIEQLDAWLTRTCQESS